MKMFFFQYVIDNISDVIISRNVCHVSVLRRRIDLLKMQQETNTDHIKDRGQYDLDQWQNVRLQTTD